MKNLNKRILIIPSLVFVFMACSVSTIDYEEPVYIEKTEHSYNISSRSNIDTGRNIEQVQQIVEVEEPMLNYSLDFKIPSNVSAEQLEKGLKNNLKNYASTFVEVEKQYGINAILFSALSAEESGWAEKGWSDRNNIFGYCYGKRYDTVEDCIWEVARLVDAEYLTKKSDDSENPKQGRYYKGTMLNDVNYYYCTNDEWDKRISVIAKNIYERILEDS